ncbi:hypothetical protein ABZP36_026985 [Zizania latifolia]
MNYIRQDNRSLSENWSGIGLDHEGQEDEPTLSADSCIKSASKRTDLPEFKVVTTCNTCKPPAISRHPEADVNALKNISSGMPLSNYHPSSCSRPRQKGPHILSWLLPKSKRKPNSDMSPNTFECENMSQLLKEWGVFSLESLKKELAEANEHRDAALQEVKSSLGELTTKLVSLEGYCSELKKALKQATRAKNIISHSKRSDRLDNFASFVALGNLSWNEVLKEGTKYHCEDFSRFCDQKMSCIVSMLNWSWPWAEQLLPCFFVAAKCIWLLHLLAFSFSPPLMILRVEENRVFDQMYMEDIHLDKQRSQNPCQVKIMVTPGFCRRSGA